MRIAWHTEEDPPKEEDDYLVTYSHGTMDICRWTDASRFGGHKYKTDWHWIHEQYCEVVAWMPLPEPYKAESEDKSVSAILDDMKSGVDGLIDDGLKMIEKRRKENTECT